jgi:hypothetical protein
MVLDVLVVVVVVGDAPTTFQDLGGGKLSIVIFCHRIIEL